MRLRVLGCSGGIGGHRHPTSYAIGEDVLIDAGAGLGALDLDEMRLVRHVFLTHSHLDHVGGLPHLVDSIFESIERPLVVHAQEVTIQAMGDHLLNWTIWPNFAELPSKHDPVLAYEAMAPGERLTVDGRTFEMIPGNHTVPSVAYVVTEGEKVFCYTGDTTTNDTIWAGLNRLDRLDLLLVECAFPNRMRAIADLSKHYAPCLLAEDLHKLRHEPRIGITHMKPGVEETIWNECVEAISDRELFRVRQDEVVEI